VAGTVIGLWWLACTNPLPPEPPPINEVVLAAPQVSLQELGWTHEGHKGRAWVARVPRGVLLQLVPAETPRPLPELAPLAGNGVAINGGFYGPDGKALGLVRTEGSDRTPLSAQGGSGVLTWGPDLPIQVVHRDAWADQGPTALQSVDRLVDGGESLVKPREGAPRAARSAIGLTADAVLFVVSVGKGSIASENSDRVVLQRTSGQGQPLWVFAAWLAEELGVAQALNLDGAISTAMRVRVGDTLLDIVGEAGTVNAVGWGVSPAAPP